MVSDTVAIAVLITQLLLCAFGIIFLLSGIDDLVIDAIYIGSKIISTLRHTYKESVGEAELLEQQEAFIAIMIPAWDESAVIRPMLVNMVKTIEYHNYHIFVGTYPNDQHTREEVDIVAAEYPHIHRIVCPNPGPTCKSDCLNAVYEGILLFEQEQRLTFSAFVMEDCEDLVHPLHLKLINHYIPRYDMVQLPVFPLERPWQDFTSGHYIDEFCELHGKDIVVRQLLSGSIPAAGVGCAFSRKAVSAVARAREEIFNTSSLTEDYEFGLSIGALGLKCIFVNQLIPDITVKQDTWKRNGLPDRHISVREYFPSTFRTAVKQKSRWVLGIAIQGWANLGWKGGLATRYMLARDRKTLVTSEVSLLGYLIVIFVVCLQTYTWLAPDSYRYPPLVEQGSWLSRILFVNMFFLINRLSWRIYSVYRIYGAPQCWLAIPRQVWSNIINGFATNRAIYLFLRAKLLGKRIAWDKTAHVLPTHVVAAHSPRRLGEILVARGVISAEQLEEALQIQKSGGAPLGSILVLLGSISEDELLTVVAEQTQRPRRSIDPWLTPVEVLRTVEHRWAVAFSVYPLEILSDGAVLLATADPLSRSEQSEIESGIGRAVEICWAPRAQVALAIRYGYQRAELIEADQAENDSQGREVSDFSDLARSGEYRRLGDLLVEQGAVGFRELKLAAKQFAVEGGCRFGEFLLKYGYVSREDLDEALRRQQVACEMQAE